MHSNRLRPFAWRNMSILREKGSLERIFGGFAVELTLLSTDDSLVQIQVAGEIRAVDASGEATAFEKLLGPAGYGGCALLDLSKAKSIFSGGVSWLLVLHKRFVQNGGQLILHSVPRIVMEVLRVMRLDLVLTITDDAEQAAHLVAEGRE
jgi:anti-anti-sigma factor